MSEIFFAPCGDGASNLLCGTLSAEPVVPNDKLLRSPDAADHSFEKG
jgi:hypothetical protein